MLAGVGAAGVGSRLRDRASRRARRAVASGRWWGLSPAWGLAAAAMLVGAVSAAIAQVEVTVGTGGVTVRTGWATRRRTSSGVAGSDRIADVRARRPPGSRSSSSGSRTRRLRRAREHDLGAARHANPRTDVGCRARADIPSDDRAERGTPAGRARASDPADQPRSAGRRRTDFERLGRVMEQLQRTAVETFQRQRALEDHVDARRPAAVIVVGSINLSEVSS